VVVNAPSKKIYYGNLVAGPIFREITDRIYVREYGLQEKEEETKRLVQAPYSKSGRSEELLSVFNYLDLPLEVEQPEAGWVSTRSLTDSVVALPRSIPDRLVPNVVDMGLKDALYLLESRGLKVMVDGRGTVREQSIIPGTVIRGKEVITLKMSIREG